MLRGRWDCRRVERCLRGVRFLLRLRFSVLRPVFRCLLLGGLLEFSLWLHPVSKTSVWKWIRKFEEKMPVVSEKKRRYLIALDETVVKSNKKAYYVYSAVDVEKNELILMRVYTNRNYLVSRSFLKEVLKFCENKPRFIVDKAPWLIDALKSLNLEFEHQTFRREKSS